MRGSVFREFYRQRVAEDFEKGIVTCRSSLNCYQLAKYMGITESYFECNTHAYEPSAGDGEKKVKLGSVSWEEFDHKKPPKYRYANGVKTLVRSWKSFHVSYSPVISCTLCPRIGGLRHVQYRSNRLGIVLCMSCYNKQRPLAKRIAKLEDLALTYRRGIRDIAKAATEKRKQQKLMENI